MVRRPITTFAAPQFPPMERRVVADQHDVPGPLNGWFEPAKKGCCSIQLSAGSASARNGQAVLVDFQGTVIVIAPSCAALATNVKLTSFA